MQNSIVVSILFPAILLLLNIVSYVMLLPVININGTDTGNEETFNVTEFDEDIADDDNSTSSDKWRVRTRQREKEERLEGIKHRILKELGLHQNQISTPPTNLPILSEKQKENMKFFYHRVINLTEDTFSSEEQHVQHLQGFLPSCALPRSINKSAWQRREKYYLYFKVDHALNKEVIIGSAFIRLWQSPNSMESNKVESMHTKPTHPWFGSDSSEEEYADGSARNLQGKRFKVNIYSLMTPLKKAGKVKRKLVNSKIILADHSGWKTFSVKSAIERWLTGRRNFGFEVTVQDFSGKFHPPSNIFTQVNCSSIDRISETILPFSNLIQNFSSTSADSLPEEDPLLTSNRTYPTLDLHTLKVRREIENIQRPHRVSYNIDLSKHNLTALKLINREKRSNCPCKRVDIEMNLEGIGLDFVPEPKTIMLSSCVADTSITGSRCEATETEDVDITHQNGSWMETITIPKLNQTACSCDLL